MEQSFDMILSDGIFQHRLMVRFTSVPGLGGQRPAIFSSFPTARNDSNMIQ
jgi:hypothetical protein